MRLLERGIVYVRRVGGFAIDGVVAFVPIGLSLLGSAGFWSSDFRSDGALVLIPLFAIAFVAY